MAVPKEVVCVRDEAISSPPPVVHEYMKWREIDKLALDRSRATIFVLRAISHAHFNDLLSYAGNIEQRYQLAFRASVRLVHNLRSEETGQIMRPWTPAFDDSDCLPVGELERFDWSEIQEIGSVAYQACFLRRTKRPRFRLPDICLDSWVDQARPRADESPQQRDPNSSKASSPKQEAKPPSDETTSATPRFDESTGSRTAATAEESAA